MSKDRKNRISLISLMVVLAIMLFPSLWKHFSNMAERPLSGDVSLAKNETFNMDKWFSGEYSETKNNYFNDNFGFHNFFIRLRNEIYYLTFRKPGAKDVRVGKNGFLYETRYLKTHAGLDFIGEYKITEMVNKMKFIQDTLQKLGIKFAVLFAPGKASFYSEYIPSPYDISSKQTNYLEYVEKAKEYHLNFVDYNAMFSRLKLVTKYPLYSKIGTHWSCYGMAVAFDTLLSFMEKSSSKKLPEMDIRKIYLSDSLHTPDDDIGQGLNLLCLPSHFAMAYPEIEWRSDNKTFKPRVLTISDSYWMGIYFINLPSSAFSYHEFWYYNKQIYNYDKSGKTGDPADFDLKESVEQNDFVFIMASEAQLSQLGWGFIEDLYNIYKNGDNEFNKKNRKKHAEVTRIKSGIMSNESWFFQVRKQAKEINISVDSCLELNAEYVYDQQHKNDSTGKINSRNEKINSLINEIRANPGWYAQIKEKAREHCISVDSSLHADAEWIMNQQEKKN